ncbi:CheR family methyltransferase [Marinobacter sp. NSM]|uniref:CheR family methyltransferase n=1 Tax=Marinobacter sp. NSM TaxID=3458004 RepID=UPI004036431C
MNSGAAAKASREFEYTDSDFEAIRQRLHAAAGINLSKSKNQLVYSRMARRLRAVGVKSFEAYLKYLDGNEGEQEEFINALTTNLTSFFRESHHFEILADFLRSNAKPGKRFNLWCAAASTGEEPYSMAMSAIEALGPRPPVKIFATDIDSQVLATARKAVYPLNRASSISEQRLKSFFLRGNGHNSGFIKVRPEVQQIVKFATLNLLDKDWPLEPPYDLIFCRNVMIYFDKPTQKRIVEKMIPLLSEGGLYVAGHSENFTYATEMIRLVGKTTYRVVRDEQR